MKRYVLPTFKVLLALIATVALVKIAFFPSTGNSATADLKPGFEVTTPTATITTGDITNTVDVAGQIVEDAAVDAKTSFTGTVDSFAVAKEATVAEGSPLIYLKKVEPQEPIVDTGAEGKPTSTKVPDKVTWSTVFAPAAGVVHFSVIENQEVTVGTVVATISPGTYSATGNISPAQQYRLTNAPTEALVTIQNGPAPFSCKNLKIGTKANTSTTTSGDGSTTTSTGDGTRVEVRCSVPTDQKVFPGLTATIGISSGSASGTLMAPVTAVEGSVGSGSVWVLSDPANPESAVKTPVTLGITDGINIQITEGVKDGDTILQFVPGKDVKRTGKPNTCEPDGSVCYDEKGEEIP
ncbi:efflux RND transporter periplasmic adaptor subunit [Actinomyces trachealis]|uniref:efflux RND transporter periplasmic adaptor subunit n=1 Tax=Actinomyces trachealis TaxID=2763540 RepID=UPI0018928CF8|nr:efflux RND transporter periplasmic adaptor subunit [Actinomyces trachealis]